LERVIQCMELRPDEVGRVDVDGRAGALGDGLEQGRVDG
jgi:hypothetical protein